MSKKNKKSTRRNLHAHDLAKEKQAQEERLKKQEKKQVQQASKGVSKDKKKNKTFRIRKGVRIQGVVVRDSESKKKALKLLKAREAFKMDVDEEGAAAAAGSKPKKKIRVAGGVRLKQSAAVKAKGSVPKGGSKAGSTAGKGAQQAAQMEVE